MTTPQTIPLASLTLSRHNARRTATNGVGDLVASITAHGLMQNLIVEPLPDGLFGVIAGGRRLAALQQLAKANTMPADLLDGIPCIIEADVGRLTEASAAENIIRQRMHPHDEFVAFRDLAAQGHGTHTIAARFGTTPLVVEQRLKLANVSPVLLRLFREDKATLEQLTALAITDDHAAQERAWGDVENYKRNPRELRATLTQAKVHSGDKRAQLIGFDAYEEAGGAILCDLFKPGEGYFADVTLLDQLVTERLQAEAEKLRAEGWSWVKVLDEAEHNFVYQCGTSQPQTRDLDAAEVAELDQLSKRGSEIRDQIDEMEYEPDFDDPIAIELDQVEARIEAINASAKSWTDRQKSKAGAAVKLGYSGTIEIHRGLIAESAKAKHQAAKNATTADGKPAPKPEPTISEAMVRRLSAHRTAALKARMMSHHRSALATLAHSLLLALNHADSRFDATRLCDVQATDANAGFAAFGFDDVNSSDALKQTQTDIAELFKTVGLPAKPKDWLNFLLLQSVETLTSLLGAIAVITLDTTQRTITDKPKAVELATHLNLDMADYWQPTVETFFGIVPRSITLEAVTEAAGKEQAARLSGMKKDELAGEAQRLLQRTGWLPKPLRATGYALRTTAREDAKPAAEEKPAKAKPAPRAKPKPAAKKQAAKVAKLAAKKAAAKAKA